MCGSFKPFSLLLFGWGDRKNAYWIVRIFSLVKWIFENWIFAIVLSGYVWSFALISRFTIPFDWYILIVYVVVLCVLNPFTIREYRFQFTSLILKANVSTTKSLFRLFINQLFGVWYQRGKWSNDRRWPKTMTKNGQYVLGGGGGHICRDYYNIYCHSNH